MRWIEDGCFGKVAPKLRLNAGLQGLQLTPEEGFILSRVDGFSSIEEICLVTGLPRTQTLETLEKLHCAGLLEVEGAPPPVPMNPKAPEPNSDGRSQSETSLEEGTSQEGGASKKGGTSMDGEAGLNEPSPRATARNGEGTGVPGFEPDPDCELSAERQQAISELYHRLDEMDFFELLGLSPDCDGREVQRAYRKISLKFHPDRFFGKRLGGFKAHLEAIFRHVSNVADYLTDDAQRETYGAELLGTGATASPPSTEVASGAHGDISPAEDARDDAESELSGTSQISDSSDARKGTGEERRILTREQRLRRLGGILGMSSQELRAVARSRKTETQERPAVTLPELSPERQKRMSTAARTGLHATLDPMRQRRQKAKTHYDEGVRAMQAGNWPSAASNLKLALTFDPMNEEYRDKEAIASVRAREVSAVSYAKRASQEDAIGRHDEAARLYAMAADRHATVEHLTKAARALLRTGELKRAVEYAIKARDSNPSSVTARVVLGNAYLTAEMPKSARREVDYALKLDANNLAAKALLKEIRKAE